MKKVTMYVLASMLVFTFALVNSQNFTEVNHEKVELTLSALPNLINMPSAVATNDGIECKVEVISCGWLAGTRQVCHQNANGLICECGTSTTCS